MAHKDTSGSGRVTSQAQRNLRQACQKGKIDTVIALLATKEKRKCTKTDCIELLSSSEDEREPAKLSFVYDDEEGNLPIHFIALGPYKSFAARSSGGGTGPNLSADYDAERAQLLAWLLPRYKLVLAAVNWQLESPVHCCIRTRSSEVLKVLADALSKQPQGEAAGAFGADRRGRTPLDLIIESKEWALLALLIKAGCQTAFEPFQTARGLLHSIFPAAQTKAAAPPTRAGTKKHPIKTFGWLSPDLKAGSSRRHHQAEAQTLSGLPEENIRVLEDTHSVLQLRRSLIADVGGRLGISETRAAEVLLDAEWKDEEAARKLRSGGADHASAVAPAGAIGGEQSEHTVSCSVCFEDFLEAKAVMRTACEHFTCDDCWRGMLKARLSEGDAHRVCCPHKCPDSLLPLHVARELIEDRSEYKRMRRLLAQQFVDSSPYMKWCPRARCGRCIFIDPDINPDSLLQAAAAGKGLNVRCACGQDFCFSCLGIPHEPASCDAAKQWRNMMKEAETELNEAWLEQNSKPCGKCGAPIQKNGGCNHMHCIKCHHHFCWVCGGTWDRDRQDGYQVHSKCGAGGAAATGYLIVRKAASSIAKAKDAAGQKRLAKHLHSFKADGCEAELLGKPAAWISKLLMLSVQASSGTLPGRATSPAEPLSKRQRVGDYQVHEEQQVIVIDDARPAEDVAGASSGPANLVLLSSDDESDEEVGPSLKRLDASLRFVLDAAAITTQARHVLQYSHVAAFFEESGSDAEQFNALQQRLHKATEALMAPLLRLPHIQHLEQMAVRSALAASPRQAVAACRAGHLGRALGARRQRGRRAGGHELGAATHAAADHATANNAPARRSLPWNFAPAAVDSEVLKQQLCYAWALNERRAHLLEAANEVKVLCQAMQQIGRPGELARLRIARVAAVLAAESPAL